MYLVKDVEIAQIYPSVTIASFGSPLLGHTKKDPDKSGNDLLYQEDTASLKFYEAGCMCLEARYYAMKLNIIDIIYIICDFCRLYPVTVV